MSIWPTIKPTSKELDTIIGKLSFYNDNKMTHAVLFASILFGQFQIKSAFLVDKNIIILKNYFLGGHSYTFYNLLYDIFIKNMLSVFTYIFLICAGIYELQRFRLYSNKAFELNVILEHYYALNKYPPIKTIGESSTKYLKLIKSHILSKRRATLLSYLIISLLIFFM